MSKIIKLTESDLTRIVKRVIAENQSKVDALVDMIKSDGLRNVEKYFGDTEKVKLFLTGTKAVETKHNRSYNGCCLYVSTKQHNHTLEARSL